MSGIDIDFQQSGASPLKVLAFLANSSEVLERVGKHAARVAARRFLVELKRNWEGQRAFLWPLSQAYQQRKQEQGLDQRILVATGELLGSLRVIETDGGFVVGPPPGQRHSRSGVLLGKLLMVIEYGSPSRNLPSRAILRQTANAMHKELVELFKAEVVKGIKHELGL